MAIQVVIHTPSVEVIPSISQNRWQKIDIKFSVWCIPHDACDLHLEYAIVLLAQARGSLGVTHDWLSPQISENGSKLSCEDLFMSWLHFMLTFFK